MDNRIKVIIIGGLVLLVLLGVGIWFARRTIRRAPFRAEMSTYLQAPTGPAKPGTSVKKVVVIDVADKDVDSLHFDLPDDLRAATPAEVTTVVWLNWSKNQIGTYTGGGSAYQWSCQVTVIDKATRTTIRQQTFTGSRPPQSVRARRGTSHSGDKPTDQVINFLRGLPRG
jgi:hypothetical protein